TCLGLTYEFPLEPIQLRLIETFSSFLHHSQRFGHGTQSFASLPGFSICLDRQGKMKGAEKLCPRGPNGGQALMHLYHSFLLFLRGQCPAPLESSQCQQLREPLLGRECNRCF